MARFLMALVFAASLATAAPGKNPAATATTAGADQTIYGKIRQEKGKPPMVITAKNQAYTVTGDDFTKAQMADSRLDGREIELDGHFTSATNFEAARMFTIKNGKRYEVTYWCDVCSIRTHMPGPCMCCQGPTKLQELPVP